MNKRIFKTLIATALAPCIAVSLISAARGGGGELAREGTPAPDFAARSEDGVTIRLRQYAGKNIVVLYFYPQDDTPGCTREACGFRDNMAALREKGIVVLGVSMDNAESHKDFSRKYNLNFPLLIDEGEKIATAYGVPVTHGSARRVTFLIGKDGVIHKVYPSVDVSKHAMDILDAVQILGLAEASGGNAPPSGE